MILSYLQNSFSHTLSTMNNLSRCRSGHKPNTAVLSIKSSHSTQPPPGPSAHVTHTTRSELSHRWRSYRASTSSKAQALILDNLKQQSHVVLIRQMDILCATNRSEKRKRHHHAASHVERSGSPLTTTHAENEYAPVWGRTESIPTALFSISTKPQQGYKQRMIFAITESRSRSGSTDKKQPDTEAAWEKIFDNCC